MRGGIGRIGVGGRIGVVVDFGWLGSWVEGLRAEEGASCDLRLIGSGARNRLSSAIGGFDSRTEVDTFGGGVLRRRLGGGRRGTRF